MTTNLRIAVSEIGRPHLPYIQEALAGRYPIKRELGKGGMATVWLIRDVRHERFVALKVMRPDLATSVGAEGGSG